LVPKADDNQVTLTAQLGDEVDNARLALWQTTDRVGDYRKAKWTRQHTIELSGQSDRVRIAQVSVPRTGTAAYFLQLQGSFGNGTFINSSNIVELGAPTIRPQPTSE
jgi:PhoPQ-activated pathogenicity-related protein